MSQGTWIVKPSFNTARTSSAAALTITCGSQEVHLKGSPKGVRDRFDREGCGGLLFVNLGNNNIPGGARGGANNNNEEKS